MRLHRHRKDALPYRDRRARARIRRQLQADLDELGTAANTQSLQLSITVCDEHAYAGFRGRIEADWRRHEVPFGTGAWPRALAAGQAGALVVPTRPPAGRRVRPLADPLFIAGPVSHHPASTPYADLVLAAVAAWVRQVGLHIGSPLLPPLVELAAHGRSSTRQQYDLGVRWSTAGA